MKISEEIAETLRDEIIAGIYKPKQRLIEEELSEKFFVSRTPIREALKQLEAAGLVTIEPYKGAFISDVDLEEIRNIYELRCVLEAFVTAQSVEHINPETVAQLRGCLERMNMCIDNNHSFLLIAAVCNIWYNMIYFTIEKRSYPCSGNSPAKV